MSQSIDLSTTATTACTFNSSTVEKINLNGTQIWTKPASGGPVYYNLTGTDSTSPEPYIYVNDGAATLTWYWIRRSDGKLFTYLNPGGATIAYTFAICVYGCNWSAGTGAFLGPAATSGPTSLYTPMSTTAIYTKIP